MKKTSLKDLANYLGLSQTTVSRGLSNYPEVTQTTKARIIEAAEKLNYAPSSSAQKLAMGKSFTIGHIIALTDHLTLNPFYADFIAGAGETYAEHGYDLLLSMATKDKELETYRNLTNAQKVDGFILSEPVPNDPRIRLLQDLNMPFIVHGRAHAKTEDAQDYSWLDVNNVAGFTQATQHLLSAGHQEIALINGPETFQFAIQRRRGFEAAMQSASLATRQSWMIATDMSEQSGFEAAQKLLQASEKPTAIICASVLMAMGIQRAANGLGLLLGRDLSLICWDDCLSGFHNSEVMPQFTAMQSSIFMAGAQTAEMLIAQIRDPAKTVRHKLLEARLTQGLSTMPHAQNDES